MAAAATETAGSSSSGSADSYIGSLISLTSKSEIRYEGVLFNINSEESSIGLRNVRSFGTEGRRKDGPQVPPSDKIYEYILFRGSDIKDLQVKSSPPVQNTTSMHNDPAIIQSHYPQAASTALPSGTGSVPDSHGSQVGLARPPFQGNPPLYQPGGSLGPWGSSLLPSTSGGLAMPMYWQGFYGSSNGLQPQQQSLLQPPPGLSMLPSMQQSMQYHPMNVSIPTGASSLPTSQLSEHLPLLPPLGTGTSNLLSPMFPVQNSAIVSDSSANLVPDKAFTGTFSTAASSNSLPLAPPLSTGLDNTASARPVSEPKTIPGYIMPFKNMSESASSNGVTSNLILKDGTVPSLVTPGQLLHLGLPPLTSAQTSQTAQKDVEVVQLSSTESPPPPTAASVATEVQEPILPLPSQLDRKLRGPPMYAQRGGRGGRGRGRANEISHSATRFTEDFDFMAMNEKFNKDEVWGDLGRTNRGQEDGDGVQEEDNVGKHESKPIYVKDDFFDSLSCDALDAGSRNGRTRFSEQVRRDTETFGDFPRFHGGRGGRGPFRGGRSCGGSHYGRGYGGYENHGRGYGYGYENHGRGYGYGYGYGYENHGRGNGYENRGRGNGYENRGRGNGFENHGRGNAYAPRGRGYGMSSHASS